MRALRLIVGGMILFCVGAAHASAAEPHWPHWRGPLATGAAPDANPPVTWSAEENVAWRAEIPGSGSATPIVVGDLVVVQTAIDTGRSSGGERAEAEPRQAQGEGRGQGGRFGGRGRGGGGGPRTVHEFVVIAYDRASGEERWRTTVYEQAPSAGVRQGEGTYASNSPVSDGEHIWAYFGSYGLHCLDLEGEVLWSEQLGEMTKRGEFGEGSSPALHDGRLVVVRDHEGDSEVVALDAASGEILWREEREERSSWATPLIVEAGGRTQVIVPATGASQAYDLESGEVIWTATGMTSNVIPSPVHADGVAYLISGFRGEALQAIRLAEAEGDIDESEAIVWTHNHRTPYVPSPLLYEGVLYFLNANSGILTALDAATGEPHHLTQRLPLSGVYASPVAAAGRVYIAGRDGQVVVLEHNLEAFNVIAVNEIDDTFDASPVLVGEQLFLRGAEHLYCIEASR